MAEITSSGAPAFVSYVSTGVLRRAAIFALLLGSALAVVNQSAALFGAGSIEVLPLVLVYVTPFIVVTISQGVAIRRAEIDRRERPRRKPRSFAATAMSHGIPARAVALGVAMGAINTALVAAAAFLARGTVETLPIVLIAQAVVLPILFSVISQTIAYRRAATRA